MENNTPLPVEVVNEINAKAIEIALKFVPDINSPGYRAIKGAAIKGATAYASKLHQVEQENAELRRWNDKLKQQAEGWRPLLEATAGGSVARLEFIGF